MAKFFTILSTGFVLMSLAACGDDSPNANPVDNQPPPTASSLNWNEVEHEYYIDMVSPQTCDMPFKIKVGQNGSYVAGPCTSGGVDTKTGHITNNELSQLNEMIDEVGASNLSENKCSQGEAFVGSSTSLTVEGTKRTVYRHFPDQLCYRGNKQASEGLNAFVNSLGEKYYPSRP